MTARTDARVSTLLGRSTVRSEGCGIIPFCGKALPAMLCANPLTGGLTVTLAGRSVGPTGGPSEHAAVHVW